MHESFFINFLDQIRYDKFIQADAETEGAATD